MVIIAVGTRIRVPRPRTCTLALEIFFGLSVHVRACRSLKNQTFSDDFAG
jgi:hypothetical protein